VSDSPPHPDHEAEQAYILSARKALDGMQERAAAVLEFGERAVEEENTV